MSLCEGVIQVLEASARQEGFSRVKTVWLEIIEVPGRAWCLPCAAPVAIRERFDACPHCGSHQLQVTGGEELRVKELEVE
jgi:hydrogenase nickel incorporation protein HypA/HybF